VKRCVTKNSPEDDVARRDERSGDGAPTTTIFVALLDEGVEVWRPVEASQLPNGLFRIESENADSKCETWQFSTGTIVRCEQRNFDDGKSGLVAVQSAGDP
jgi:hypothetical protein